MATSSNSEARASSSIDVSVVTPILDLIKSGESYGDSPFGLINSYGVWEGEFVDSGLEELTIGEIIEEQKKRKTTPAGAYQIRRKTLEWLVNESRFKKRFSLDDKFDKDTQDKLALALLEHRGLKGFLEGKDKGGKAFKKGLSQEWAALPDPDSPDGDSYYKGVGVNKAHASSEQVDLALHDALVKYSDPTFELDPKPEFEPALESKLAATQMATENGMFSEIQPQSSRVPKQYISAGMLSEITDLPTRRGGGEILGDAVVSAQPVDPTPPPMPPRLEEVVPTQRGQIPILGVGTPRRSQRSGIFPEVEVNAQRVDETPPPLPELQEVTPTQRGQVPIPQGPQLEEVSVPQRTGRFSEIQPKSSRIDPTPPPLPELEEVVPTQRGQIPIPERPSVAPEEPKPVAPEKTVEEEKWEPSVNAIVYEKPKKKGWGNVGVKQSAPKSLPAGFAFDRQAIIAAAEAQSAENKKKDLGITRSVMEGLTFDLYDEASAYFDSMKNDKPYDLARFQYQQEQGEFEMMNPDLATGLELSASFIPGVGGFKFLEGAGKVVTKLDSARKTRQFTKGKKEIDYTAPDGSVEKVLVRKDYGDRVRVTGADGKAKTVSKSRLTVEPEALAGAEVGYKTLGAIEGGFWGFNSGNDGDRATSTVIGGVAGLTMGAAIDMFRAPKYGNIGSEADDDMMMISGKYMPEVVENIRLQSSRALGEAQDARANPIPDDGIAAMFGEPAPVPAQFSYIDPYQTSPLAREKRTQGFGGAWDTVVEKYKDIALGISDRIMLDFSPQWGARVQVGDESALRSMAVDLPSYVDPVTPSLTLEIEDLHFRGMMLDYAKGEQSIDTITDYVAKKISPQQAVMLRRHIDWANRKNKEHIEAVSGKTYDAPTYLSTKLTPTKKAEKNSLDRDYDLPDDPGLLNRTRGNYKNNRIDPRTGERFIEVNPNDYMPVLATNVKRIMNNERIVQIAKKMGMPVVRDMKHPDDFFKAMERHVVDMGLDDDLARRGTHLIKENLTGQGRSPNQWVQALNSFGYATTLAGPISAILNLHDPMIASVKYGLGNTLKGIGQPRYDVRARGIDQNVGEFLNKVVDMYSNDRKAFEYMVADAMRTGTDWLMKGSGFAAMDNIGKSGTIKAILNHAAESAAKDHKTVWLNSKEQFTKGYLGRQWGFYFDTAELNMIQRELMKHGADFTKYEGKAKELLEELAFAGLGQQQLISGMGRPLAWARHPNLRPMWALRGFAIKQQALIMREILFNIAAGRTDEAIKFMARYVALAAGSFGLLNEARQWVFGDGEASLPGVIMGMGDQILSTLTVNTVGLNDYQYGRLMESGLIGTVAESLVPTPISRLYDFAKSGYQGSTDPTLDLRTELIQEVPTLRQPLNAVQNLAENTDIIPKPLENLERRIRPGEQR